jgi:hypothetical protein
METRIINLPAMHVIGMAYVGKNENEEIHSMWDDFLPRADEVQGKIRCPPPKYYPNAPTDNRRISSTTTCSSFSLLSASCAIIGLLSFHPPSAGCELALPEG